MRSWGNFFLSERSVNIHWTHTIPAAGMVWQHLRQMFSNFFNKVGYCLCLKLVWTFLQRRIQVLFFKRKEFLGLFVKNSSMDYAFIFFAFVNGQEKFDPSLWKPFSLQPFWSKRIETFYPPKNILYLFVLLGKKWNFVFCLNFFPQFFFVCKKNGKLEEEQN